MWLKRLRSAFAGISSGVVCDCQCKTCLPSAETTADRSMDAGTQPLCVAPIAHVASQRTKRSSASKCETWLMPPLSAISETRVPTIRLCFQSSI
mmetsp:Transcript_113625/g.178796  ORF Transcript_113625/g.178796 Transcript_113625/m.178796 type:complete len:94 (-) Transcript_113625:221-502(-)